jgi:hypothetical protein
MAIVFIFRLFLSFASLYSFVRQRKFIKEKVAESGYSKLKPVFRKFLIKKVNLYFSVAESCRMGTRRIRYQRFQPLGTVQNLNNSKFPCYGDKLLDFESALYIYSYTFRK